MDEMRESLGEAILRLREECSEATISDIERRIGPDDFASFQIVHIRPAASGNSIQTHVSGYGRNGSHVLRAAFVELALWGLFDKAERDWVIQAFERLREARN